MSLARITHKKKSLHTFHEHPFLINCINLCRFWHGHTKCNFCYNVVDTFLCMCDGFRVPGAFPPGHLVTVVKPHRAWIPTSLTPSLTYIANGGPQGSHLTPPSNGG